MAVDKNIPTIRFSYKITNSYKRKSKNRTFYERYIPYRKIPRNGNAILLL